LSKAGRNSVLSAIGKSLWFEINRWRGTAFHITGAAMWKEQEQKARLVQSRCKLAKVAA